MRSSRQVARLAILGAVVLGVTPARASFHLMQIEQVVGGVCGDTAAQAIQLRMRTGGQNLVGSAGASLVAYDATGANPVTLITFASNVTSAVAGARILVTTSEFSLQNGPTPDFTLVNTIPASYLTAGKLAFQQGSGIWWSVSWGAYSGPNTGFTVAQGGNDADGNFGPAEGGALPSAGFQALHFPGLASAPSTNNAADYALTSGGAAFTNNAGTSGTALDCTIFTDGFESSDTSAWSRKEP